VSPAIHYTNPKGLHYLLPNEATENLFRYHGGEPERDVIEWAATFLDPTKAFLDIGSHVGSYTFNYATRCAAVHAFEPQLDILHMLCGGIALNGFENVFPYPTALANRGDKDGCMLRRISADGGGSSIVQLPHNELGSSSEVNCCTLDSLDLIQVGFIKIDVEGAEALVVDGGRNTLHVNGYPPILFECWPHDWFQDAKDVLLMMLTDLGYSVRAVPNTRELFLAEHP
jgi:FkbM family methyltransferase